MSFNFLFAMPIYKTGSFSKDAVAMYIMQPEWQFLSSKHLDCCLQLQVFVAALVLFMYIDIIYI